MHPNDFLLVLQDLERADIVNASTIVGCTDAEISAIEARYQVKLPLTYRHYLSCMGHDSARLFLHDHVETTYEAVLTMNDDFRAALPRPYVLPGDAILILDRMGDFHQFIRCNQPMDSSVWGIDFAGKVSLCADSVLDWLLFWAREAEFFATSDKTGRSRRDNLRY